MNKLIKYAGLGLLSGAVIFSAATYAHMDSEGDYERKDCDKHKKWSKGGDRGLGKIKHAIKHLDLSESQEEEIESIMANAKPAMKSMHQAMKESREELRSLMKSGEYNEESVQQAANNQANLMASKLVFMAQTKAEIFKVLTPEQQQELTEKFESRKHH